MADIVQQLQSYKVALRHLEEGMQADSKAQDLRKKAGVEANAGNKKLLEEEERRYWVMAYSSYQQSVKQGNSESFAKLGFFFLTGMGGATVDKGKAFQYFCQSAKRGHSSAMFNAAMMLERGDGVIKDVAGALMWYEKAATKGNETAMIKAAEILEKDDKQQLQALAWYEKAAQSRNSKIAEHAQKQCQRLRGKLPAFAMSPVKMG